MRAVHLSFTVNGVRQELTSQVNRTLLDILREDLKLTGTKNGCEVGECGACTVIMDGEPVNACLVLAGQIDGSAILTIEGVGTQENPHPLQKAFTEVGAVQCGFCIPGMIMAAKALLDHHPNPNRAQIQEGLSGNLCRCTGYTKIFEAVELAAREICHE